MSAANQIRAFLSGLWSDHPNVHKGIFAFMVSAIATPDKKIPTSRLDFPDHPFEGQRRVYDAFAIAGFLRIKDHFEDPRSVTTHLTRSLAPYTDHAARLLDRPVTPVDLLWHYWLLLLGERRLHQPVDRILLDQLWSRAFSHQSGEHGHLHPLSPDTLLESFVYDELTALHAAYNSARTLNNAAMLDQVRRAIRWHVQNTQPDNTTNEPWALAAFAELDDTHTFAAQQLHDTTTHLARNPVSSDGTIPIPAALLADALLTLEDA